MKSPTYSPIPLGSGAMASTSTKQMPAKSPETVRPKWGWARPTVWLRLQTVQVSAKSPVKITPKPGSSPWTNPAKSPGIAKNTNGQ